MPLTQARRTRPPRPAAPRATAHRARPAPAQTSVQTNAAYIVDDNVCLSLWLGGSVPTDFLQAAFGWPLLDGVDASTLRLLPADSSAAAGQLHAIVDALRAQSPGCWKPLRVMKQGTDDAPFARALVEDQTKQMMGYAEFLVHCHRYILTKMS